MALTFGPVGGHQGFAAGVLRLAAAPAFADFFSCLEKFPEKHENGGKTHWPRSPTPHGFEPSAIGSLRAIFSEFFQSVDVETGVFLVRGSPANEARA